MILDASFGKYIIKIGCNGLALPTADIAPGKAPVEWFPDLGTIRRVVH